MLESIEKLRKLARPYLDGQAIADEIEREVAERYMPLPLDADGVPIRVGDVLEHPTGERSTVRFMTLNDHGWTINARGWKPDSMRHYHEPTVEDLLFEILEKAAPRGFEDGSYVFGLSDDEIAKYADKLREVIADE